MDYAIILADKFEGRQFSVADTYESIVSLDGGPIPSKKELEDLWPEVEHSRAMRNVEHARALAYRETADPLFFQYQRGEATEKEWLDAVKSVKTAHPYPKA